MEKEPLTIENEVVKSNVGKESKNEMFQGMNTEERLDMPKTGTKTNKEEDIKKAKSLKERILSAFGSNPEKNIKKGETRMETNPKLKAMYEDVKKTNPERAEKLKMAFGKYEYSKWDDKKQDYIDASVYTEHVNG